MRMAVGSVLLGLLVWSPGAPQVWAATHTGPLDGTKWKIRGLPDEAATRMGEKPSKDALIFKAGNMTSTACVKYGFKASPYAASQSGTAWSVNTEQVSPKHGKMTWAGQVNGEVITGTMVWTKIDGTMLHYTFEGTKARKPKFLSWFSSLHAPWSVPRASQMQPTR